MATTESESTFTVFVGQTRVFGGDRRTMLEQTKAHLDEGGEPVLIFDDQTGRQVDFDFSGELADVLDRVEGPAKKSGPGRPKLGVSSREISLLPRHWEWLETQPQGTSAALRRLVDEARKRAPDQARARKIREAADRFMGAMAGNLPGFEEATRALYAKKQERFEALVRGWPADIRAHVLRLTREAAMLDGDAS